MNRFAMSACACLLATAVLAGCTPNKEMGAEDRNGNQAKYDAFGINLNNDNTGTDKGPAGMVAQKMAQNREPRLMTRLERYAENLPGVMDIKVLAYKDTLVVGVLPVDTPKPDEVNPNPSIPHAPGSIVRIDNGHTDNLQKRVVDRMRVRLAGESQFNILYVSTNPAIYDRISNLHSQIEQGGMVSDEAFQVLINDIGYTVKGYSLVD